ncbi:MAG: U32 family peptidase [Candidatus Omnitrophica bacterium]|nr:U32 family peptidase [Candidatus Omnitrophota bacterium]
MRFFVPTNWQKDLIPRIGKDSIGELYGKLAADFVGGGKLSYQLPQVSKKQIAAHVKEIHKHGLKFDYLLNSTCLNNLEWTMSGQKRLHSLLGWLGEIGVDSVTVSIPYLLEMIKKQYPRFKVYISTLAGINTVQRAKYWENLGADRITLLNLDVNRNFRLLKQLRKNIRCELQLIANVNCLYECPFYLYHANLASHGSQSSHLTKGFAIDYCRLSCRYRQLNNPVDFIRSTWIRPEDIHYYEEVGIDWIKLIDRGMTTETILTIVDAYSRRKYEGNLLDLFPDHTKNIMFRSLNPLHKLRYFFRPFSVNIGRLFKNRKILTNIGVYIDNRKLDGFLFHFLNHDCSLTSCKECGYCEEVAKRVVKIDADLQLQGSDRYCEYLEDLISGRMFRYSG